MARMVVSPPAPARTNRRASPLQIDPEIDPLARRPPPVPVPLGHDILGRRRGVLVRDPRVASPASTPPPPSPWPRPLMLPAVQSARIRGAAVAVGEQPQADRPGHAQLPRAPTTSSPGRSATRTASPCCPGGWRSCRSSSSRPCSTSSTWTSRGTAPTTAPHGADARRLRGPERPGRAGQDVLPRRSRPGDPVRPGGEGRSNIADITDGTSNTLGGGRGPRGRRVDQARQRASPSTTRPTTPATSSPSSAATSPAGSTPCSWTVGEVPQGHDQPGRPEGPDHQERGRDRLIEPALAIRPRSHGSGRASDPSRGHASAPREHATRCEGRSGIAPPAPSRGLTMRARGASSRFLRGRGDLRCDRTARDPPARARPPVENRPCPRPQRPQRGEAIGTEAGHAPRIGGGSTPNSRRTCPGRRPGSRPIPTSAPCMTARPNSSWTAGSGSGPGWPWPLIASWRGAWATPSRDRSSGPRRAWNCSTPSCSPTTT